MERKREFHKETSLMGIDYIKLLIGLTVAKGAGIAQWYSTGLRVR
jgi:hypothetical protein